MRNEFSTVCRFQAWFDLFKDEGLLQKEIINGLVDQSIARAIELLVQFIQLGESFAVCVSITTVQPPCRYEGPFAAVRSEEHECPFEMVSS